jgi:tRNA A-37 threonylcarbamoyl transferase component Bud32/membrane-associated phospholipid phosphatase
MHTFRRSPDSGADHPGSSRFVAAPAEGRRRRPSGEPPALPRQLETSGRLYLGLAGAVVAVWIAAFLIKPLAEAITRIDLSILRAIEDVRTAFMTDVMDAVHSLGSEFLIRPVRIATFVALLGFRRFRHLVVLVVASLAVTLLTTTLATAIARPRPVGIDILGSWDGFSHPSRPVAELALVLMAVLYTLVPPGDVRNRGKWVAGALIGALVAARLYLGVDHPTDDVVAVVIGVALPVLAFRLATPNAIFPVFYKRRRTAHLEVEGRREEAIMLACQQQLGMHVVEVTPYGLHGSAGSTPVQLTVATDGDERAHLFGKLYAANHLRSDRSYKLARTILYGRLEDEHPFHSVRALVEYEDYLLRVMRDAGLPTAEPYGVVEITPEREYLVVTEFFDAACEISKAEITDDVIDQSLEMVRRMWDAGLAHRDIKPANVLVQDGEVRLIDVAFAAVRPSPWRQAVDLANMMLVLALFSDASRVYERALRVFHPEEIAEAFAATRSATIPSQSRGMLRAARRDLIGEFRQLAPERRRIAIQRWSWRRIGLTAAVGFAVWVALSLLVLNLQYLGLG